MNEDQKTHLVFGMNLPVIAELPHGFKLVAHKNGPAIANDTSLCTLLYQVDTEAERTAENDAMEIREAAIREYLKLSWPLVRDQFTFED